MMHAVDGRKFENTSLQKSCLAGLELLHSASFAFCAVARISIERPGTATESSMKLL